MTLQAASMSEPLFWTPDAIHELARQLHTAMLTFNTAMGTANGAKQVPEGEIEAWRVFRDQWAKWYGATTGATWLWSSTVSTIESYANQLTAWRAKYAQWTGKQAAGTDPTAIKAGIQIDTSGEQTIKPIDWNPLYWGLGTLIVLGGGYWYWLNKDTGGKPGWSQRKAPANWRSREEKKYLDRQNHTPTARAVALSGLRKLRRAH